MFRTIRGTGRAASSVLSGSLPARRTASSSSSSPSYYSKSTSSYSYTPKSTSTGWKPPSATGSTGTRPTTVRPASARTVPATSAASSSTSYASPSQSQSQPQTSETTSTSTGPSLRPPADDEPHPFAPSMRVPNVNGDDFNYTLDDLSQVGTDGSFLSSTPVDWSRSFSGLSTIPFDKDAREILLEPIATVDIEVKPDGIVYLPEIKYRRILNRAFGPGGWGLAPRGETTITPKLVTREYGLVVHGRLVSIARGEQQYFDIEGVPTATEGCKSNALMRCCKDLGIASELWDPVFIRDFMRKNASEVWVEHVVTKKKRKITIKNGATVAYPYKISSGTVSR